MARYLVEIPITGSVSVEVSANNEEEAIENAYTQCNQDIINYIKTISLANWYDNNTNIDISCINEYDDTEEKHILKYDDLEDYQKAYIELICQEYDEEDEDTIPYLNKQENNGVVWYDDESCTIINETNLITVYEEDIDDFFTNSLDELGLSNNIYETLKYCIDKPKLYDILMEEFKYKLINNKRWYWLEDITITA